MYEQTRGSGTTDFALKTWLGTAGSRGLSFLQSDAAHRASQFPLRCSPPVVEGSEDRRRAIVEGQSAIFRVESQSFEQPYAYPSYSLSQVEAVTRNWDLIEKAAAFYRVEADLVRAVAWME